MGCHDVTYSGGWLGFSSPLVAAGWWLGRDGCEMVVGKLQRQVERSAKGKKGSNENNLVCALSRIAAALAAGLAANVDCALGLRSLAVGVISNSQLCALAAGHLPSLVDFHS
jgi:hypothetical protein